MAHIQIQCQNCGAKYKIPEEFKGDSAKCKQCGSAIDVASQRQASPTEAPAAKPATGRTRRGETAAGSTASSSRRRGADRGGRGARPSRRRRGESEQEEPARAAAAAGGRRRRGRRGEDDEGTDEQGGRPHRERKKDPTPIVVGAIIGVLAIVAVVLVYTSWGKVTENVKLPGFEKEHAAAQKRKANEAEQDRQKQLEAAKTEQERLAKEAADKKAAAKQAKEAAAKNKIPVKVEKLEEIFNPGTLDKVAWSDAVSADKRKELEELVGVATASGLPGIRAQRHLEETGWAALIPLTNKLQTLDFKTTKGNNDAFVLAQLVERITGWDPQLATMTEGDKVEPRVAHENAIGVYQLHLKMTKHWATEDGLKEWQKKNVK